MGYLYNPPLFPLPKPQKKCRRSKSATPTKVKKLRVEKKVQAGKHRKANTSPALGAYFNPFGLKMPKYRAPRFSSLGWGTSNTSSVSVKKQAFDKNGSKPVRPQKASISGGR
ncbi:hypothetical protein SLS55_000768 [Diplodia seriata]|uniref:Uncharacterized protein n=1 Tax=Diplodia seriata TaxID=420778 RepID=A0ABR3CW70_9PEZI